MAKKSKLIAALASICCLAVAAGVGLSVQPFSASAEEFGLEDVTSYQMSYGASVRMKAKDGKIGIRFAATLSNSDYADLEALEQTAGISVDYGMLIVPADMMDEADLTVANVFGGNYCFEKDTENCECGKTHLATVEYDTLVDYNTKDGVMNLRGSLVNVLTENIARPFVGLGYIRYTDETGSEPVVNYLFASHAKGEDGTGEASIANNTRSMAYVAQASIEDGEDDSQNTLYNSYVKDLIANRVYKYTVNHYLPDSEGNYGTPVVETCYGTLNQTVKAEHIVKSTLENKADYYEEYATYAIDSKVSGAKAESLVYVNGMTVLNNYYKKVDTTLFDSSDSADVARFTTANTTAKVTANQTHEDVNGVEKTGVTKFEFDGENEYGSGYLKLLFDLEEVKAANAANWDYLTITMCMTTNAETNLTALPLYSKNVKFGEVALNTWVDFVIPKALFNKYDSYVLQRRHAKDYMETKKDFDTSFINSYATENVAGNYNNRLFYNNKIQYTQEGTNITYYIESITWGVNCVAPDITSVNTYAFIDGDSGTYTPSATVTDDLSTNLTPAKYEVYELDGENETLLTTTDGSYTVSKDKQYKLVVTASDSPVSDWMGGNETVKEYPITIVSLVEGLTFEDEGQAIFLKDSPAWDWWKGSSTNEGCVANYQDKNGVSKTGVLKYASSYNLQDSGGWMFLNFSDEMVADILSKLFNEDGSVNENFKLTFNMCVVVDNAGDTLKFMATTYGGFGITAQNNVWSEVTFTAADLTGEAGWTNATAATAKMQATTSGNRFIGFTGATLSASNSGAITYYIDSITWTNVAE